MSGFATASSPCTRRRSYARFGDFSFRRLAIERSPERRLRPGDDLDGRELPGRDSRGRGAHGGGGGRGRAHERGSPGRAQALRDPPRAGAGGEWRVTGVDPESIDLLAGDLT